MGASVVANVGEQQPLVLMRNVFPGIPLCNDAMCRLAPVFEHLGRQSGQGMQRGRKVWRALKIVGVLTQYLAVEGVVMRYHQTGATQCLQQRRIGSAD